MSWLDDQGRTVSRPEPEWDWKDRLILTEWERLHERLCPQCQRPLAVHAAETAECADDPDPNSAAAARYQAAYLTCPATLALDRAQQRVHEADKPALDRGFQPDRARSWFSVRDDEQMPSF